MTRPDQYVSSSEIRDYLETEYGSLTNVQQVPCPHEHAKHYPVLIFTARDDRRLVAKWREQSEDAEREYLSGRFLAEYGLPVARPIAFQRSLNLYVMEYPPGRELKIADVTDQRIKEIAGLLRRVHNLTEDLPGADRLYTRPGETFVDEMRWNYEQRIARAVPIMSPDLARKVDRVFKQLLAANQYPGARGLCRRDLFIANWYLHDSGSIHLIDHAQVSFGDIAYDVYQVQTSRPSLVRTATELETFRSAYGSKEFDRANDPTAQAIVGIVRNIGTLSWIFDVGRPQPQYQAKSIRRLRQAMELGEQALE